MDEILETPIPDIVLPKPEKIRHRYATTLIAQGVQLALAGITAGLVPRTLGPVLYGNYSFILGMASSLRNLTDLGARHTFFTFSSKIAQSGALTKLYGLWLLIQLAVSLLLITVSWTGSFNQWIWPHQRFDLVLLITTLEWLIGVVSIFQQLGDSKGRTIRTQMIMTGGALLNVTGIVGLFLMRRLNLYSYVSFLYFSTLASCTALSIYLLVLNGQFTWIGSFRAHVRDNIKKWRGYGHPLIAYGLFTTAINCIDSYLIQRLYGSSEQAYLAFSTRLSSFILVFTSSALMIYWREIASLLEAKDAVGARRVYLRFNRLLFFLSVTLSIWLSFNSRALVDVLGGLAYVSAAPVLTIMAFYPLQQTLGQLSGAAFLASERTAAYRDLGIWLAIPGLVLTYFLLAQPSYKVPGLGLGASGIALKMVVYGLITVQVYDFLNARFFAIKFRMVLMERLRSAALVCGLAALCIFGFNRLMDHFVTWSSLTRIFCSSLFYFSAIGVTMHVRPEWTGLNKNDLQSGLRFIQKRLNGSFRVAP